MFTKDTFINATFTSDEYKNVEVLYSHNDEIHPFIVDTSNLEHPDTKRLLELQDLGTIMENTKLAKKEERKQFESYVIDIAKREGLIYSEKEGVKVDFPDMLKKIFKDEKNEDDLFALKLAAFELDIVKNSKAKKKKTDLRKAETKVEVLKILFQFMK
tara:strand:+ start:5600 stop:6073 length:474 start_codon:yes stop_codon:yes gene_type:complete